MTTAFYVIKTYQSVFERRMRILQFRSPWNRPGIVDESAPDVRGEYLSGVPAPSGALKVTGPHWLSNSTIGDA